MINKQISKNNVVNIIENIKKIIFPEYFLEQEDYNGVYQKTIELLSFEISKVDENFQLLTKEFFENILVIKQQLLKDAQAGFVGDPAADSVDEVIYTYPGFNAVLIYRIAHQLANQNVRILPRIMSEYAHSITGIDINPKAIIKDSFFIDHGTGVVIGETAVIGNNVKIYQGVTLGALSTYLGQSLKGIKRHPTIEDNVVIYANATILGGNTVIGENSVIGGNSFIIKSVPKNSKIKYECQNMD